MSGPAISPGGSVLQATRPSIAAGDHFRIAVGAASVQIGSNLRAFRMKGSGSGVVRIVSDADCHVRIENDPLGGGITALGTDPFLPAGVVEYWKFKDNDAIAVIQDAAATGFLHVTISR